MKKLILVLALVFLVLDSIIVFAGQITCPTQFGNRKLPDADIKSWSQSFKNQIIDQASCQQVASKWCAQNNVEGQNGACGIAVTNWNGATKTCGLTSCLNTCAGKPGYSCQSSQHSKIADKGCKHNQICKASGGSGLAGMTGFLTYEELAIYIEEYLNNLSNGACPDPYNLTDIIIDNQVKGDADQLHYYEYLWLILSNTTGNITNPSRQIAELQYRFCQGINLTHIGAAINWTGIDISWKDECEYFYHEGDFNHNETTFTPLLGLKDFANSSDNNGFTGIDAELPLEITANQTVPATLIIRCNVTHNWTNNRSIIFISDTGAHGVGNTVFNESEGSVRGTPTGQFEGPLEPVPEFSTSTIIILVLLVAGLIVTLYYIKNKK